MRLKRIIIIFFLIVFCYILYLFGDIGSIPSTKPDNEYNKWNAVNKKLYQMEVDLQKNHELVYEMKSLLNELSQRRLHSKDDDEHKIQKMVLQPPYQDETKESKHDVKAESKVVGDEPPRMRPHTKFDTATCPMEKKSLPKTDIQMLSMYERITFDDIDGGVWKQGWNIDYNENQWNKKNKLKVFIIPHSHNDPGWLKTFEEYYRVSTKSIFSNMVTKLFERSGRKFIWAEISFLALWWKMDATESEKEAFKTLLKSGQVEIVTGGWVMNDEANSHWLSVIQQLTTGHQWLMKHLGYKPKNGWSIDPFGHSSSQPYLLKLAGLHNSVIHRVHYRVKKELALSSQLEFKWRQLWDGVGKTDMFMHMMPFYSYDVPHSCGPDPKICCQFDFRRLPNSDMSCPWKVRPVPIVNRNVAERAKLILDQWRKKSQLYRSNVVLVPLGDDFRYDRGSEWDNQYLNYEALIDYINNKEDMYTEVQFGTLQDYFSAVHEEIKLKEFPVLSGDFFTYADRGHHYWSGYYTSRPFYKNMDRVLLAYVKAAETITGQAQAVVGSFKTVQLRDLVEAARQWLSLFQHHDGITGTAKDFVVRDYALKLQTSIKHCQAAIQQAAYHLLQEPQVLEQSQDDIYFNVDEIWREHNEVPSRITITLDFISPSRRIVLYNSMTFRRQEVIHIYVSSTDVEVFDPSGKPIMAQMGPVIIGEKRLGIASGKYQLSFLVTVEPLALAVYTVKLRDPAKVNKYTSYSRVRIYNADYWNIELPSMFPVEQPTARLNENITIQAGNSTRVVTDKNGLVRTIVGADGTVFPAHMDFVVYGATKKFDNKSGAYIFLPNGAAKPFIPEPYPEMVVIEGPTRATIHVSLNSGVAYIAMQVSVYNNPSLPQNEVEIKNTFLIDPEVKDAELAMRFSTSVNNGDVFYTDLNGMQMIKRRYFEKLPLQANFYPLPAATYIQDDSTRFTILTAGPLGMAALQPGQIEIMHDRRLSSDDERGLQQGVQDNLQTKHTFKFIVENSIPCQNKVPSEHPSGQLTLGAHVSQQILQNPLINMHYADSSANVEKAPHYTPLEKSPSIGADVVLAAYHAHVKAETQDGAMVHGVGMTFQRVDLELCYGSKTITTFYPLGDGQIYIPELTSTRPEQVMESSLTFNQVRDPLPEGVLTLCPMEVRSVFVKNLDKST